MNRLSVTYKDGYAYPIKRILHRGIDDAAKIETPKYGKSPQPKLRAFTLF